MLLEVSGLNSFYGTAHVIHGVSFNIAVGESVCLLGRNGVGKSTTIKSIMGLIPKRTGNVSVEGRQTVGMPVYSIARLGLGYVPEERRIFPTITVQENLLMGERKSRPGDWTLDRIYGIFPRLKERSRQLAGTLSGGEQQMLTIGRTLMGNPKLLLVDEPTEGLAPTIIEAVEGILRQVVQSGVALLLVEQRIETAIALTNRVLVMSKGEIVFDGSTETFGQDPSIRERYLEV